MFQDYHAYLQECATQLNPSGSHPIRVRWLLAQLGVRLEKHVVQQGQRLAEVRRTPSGCYKVSLFRAHSRPERLSPRERFTLAHELGHVLIDIRYAWRPVTKQEYVFCEQICNSFAGALLVPAKVVAREAQSALSPAAAVVGLLRLSSECRVSPEVAGRRLVETCPGLGLLSAIRTTNARKREVLSVKWSASSSGDIHLARNVHLSWDSELGRALLTLSDTHSNGVRSLNVPTIGRVAYRWIGRPDTGRSMLAAIVPSPPGRPAATGDPVHTFTGGSRIGEVVAYQERSMGKG